MLDGRGDPVVCVPWHTADLARPPTRLGSPGRMATEETTMPQSMTPRRVWLALCGVAVLAFAGCATGALDCAIFRPIGLGAALGAAAISLLDTQPATRHEPVVREESLPGPGRRG